MMLVKEAMKYKSDVKLVKGTAEVDCKSIMSVLGLALVSGTKLVIRTKGSDEDQALTAIVSLIESNFKYREG
jgi:phosphocarrier protein